MLLVFIFPFLFYLLLDVAVIEEKYTYIFLKLFSQINDYVHTSCKFFIYSKPPFQFIINKKLNSLMNYSWMFITVAKKEKLPEENELHFDVLMISCSLEKKKTNTYLKLES